MENSSSTRTQSKLYPDFGVSSSLAELLGSQVPSNMDVLRHFFYFSRDKKCSPYDSYVKAAESVVERWTGSCVPLLHLQTIADHVKDLHDELK